VDAAVINTNFALEAGLNPIRDALTIESPYVNVLAVRAGQTKDARVQSLARALAGPEVRRFIEERYKGAVVPGPTGAE
jgi:D-methionine transport system substrate-binding protein